MFIPRIAEDVLARTLSSPKVSLVLGARQVGKTTLVQHVLRGQRAVFLNLDIEVDKQRLLATGALPPDEALRILGQPDVLVVDEVQRLPETSRIAKGWHDSGLPVKIILLGSSSLNLVSQTVESLTGRNVKIELPPLLFREVLCAQPWYAEAFSNAQLYAHFSQQIDAALMTCLAFGQYPETVTSSEKTPYVLNLASDYLWKDILALDLIRTPETIRRLLMLLAHQIGSEVSVNELANTLGMARQTVNRYLDLLEETFVIFRLSAFSTNPRKEIHKNQKIFFWDTGIRNALLNNFSDHPMRPDIGALWENWVIAEFAKQNLISGRQKNLYFWRTHSGSEVDLVVQSGDRIQAYEIKWRKSGSTTKAFTTRYGVEVQTIDRTHPFVSL